MKKTAIEALKLWDDNELVSTMEMGGLGPAYEYCIQFSVFELIRAFNGKIPKGDMDKVNKLFDDALSKIDKKFDLRHSGATAGAAKNLAYHYMADGYSTVLEQNKDRIIIIEKKLPQFKEKVKK